MQDKATVFLPNGASRIKICVDETEYSELQGRWYHMCRQDAQPFDNVVQMLSEIEHCCNQLCFPQSAMALRRLETPGRRKVGRGTATRKEWKQYMTEESMNRQQGKKATFIVQIQFRQNATWQGTVTWAEKNETSRFRSALELLKMMDESIADAAQGADEEVAEVSGETW